MMKAPLQAFIFLTVCGALGATTIVRNYTIATATNIAEGSDFSPEKWATAALATATNINGATLNFIGFDLATVYDVSGSIRNNTGAARRIQYVATGTVVASNLDDIDLITSKSATFFGGAQGVLGPNNVSNPNRYLAGQTKIIPVTVLGGTSSAVLTSADNSWNSFATGTGTVELPVESFAGSGSTSDSTNFTVVLASAVGATLTVTYDFTAAQIPEPSSLVLAGSAMFAFALLARRRRS